MSNLDERGEVLLGAQIGKVADEIFALAARTGRTACVEFNGTPLMARPDDADANEALKRWSEFRGRGAGVG